MIFLRRFALFGVVISLGLLYIKLALKPLDFRASLYCVAALLNSASSHDSLEIRSLMLAGSCLIICGG